ATAHRAPRHRPRPRDQLRAPGPPARDAGDRQSPAIGGRGEDDLSRPTPARTAVGPHPACGAEADPTTRGGSPTVTAAHRPGARPGMAPTGPAAVHRRPAARSGLAARDP